MKYHNMLKLLAMILAACTLVIAVTCGIVIVVLAEQELYAVDYEQWVEQFYTNRSESIASAVAESYTARNVSNLSGYELSVIGWGNTHKELSQMWNMDANSWAYSIYSYSGALLEEVHPVDVSSLKSYTYRIRVEYPVRVSETDRWTEQVEYWLPSGAAQNLHLQYHKSQQYVVCVWLAKDGIRSFSGVSLELYRVLDSFKYHFIWIGLLSLVLTVLLLVYLCRAAGRSSKTEEIRLGGLNRLPLDLYSAGLLALLPVLVPLFALCLEELLFFAESPDILYGIAAAGIALAGAACVVAGIFAIAAQWKMGWRYIIKHSLTGRLCSLLWRFVRWVFCGLHKLGNLLPLVWHYLLIAFFMAAVPGFCVIMCVVTHGLFRVFWSLLMIGALGWDMVIICYGAYAYGTVLKGIRTMAAGELDTGINTKYLLGPYKTCADGLNTVADVAVEAARKRMHSERMRAELVTNVSHDIKTPLTSVINYIDLLQKAETREQTDQYLQVLDRQSQKLKKLIDDLMDMSKASSGTMTVNMEQLDAAEAVSQALGEFSDRLEENDLLLVLRKPEEPVPVMADGRLLWRVLHNLMSNVVKYALPGTRVYVDVEQKKNTVRISLKNISKEPLNISAEELTERFVRGDASRNTEGSGLGLNIAQSFMQLQKGTMEVAVDGDLFKVTLVFTAE